MRTTSVNQVFKETEAQRGQGTYLRSHSRVIAKPGLRLGLRIKK